MKPSRWAALLTLVAVPAAGEPGAAYPEFDDPQLRLGRAVWLANCRDCHANALSDAPQVKDKAAWTSRLAKGRDTLYVHALVGFIGPAGTEMPPRGGNASLTDAEVRAAVDYMIILVTP